MKAPGGWRGKAGTRHQRGYGAAWDKLREIILCRDRRLCQQCLRAGKAGHAHAVDHIIPKSKGGTDDLDNLEALCKRCHAEKTAHEGAEAQAALREEGRRRIGEDGWPIEPKVLGYSIPHGVRPSGIPVFVVCGPPASGKTTHVARHAKGGDKVIDLDQIKVRVGGKPYDQSESIIRKAMAYRDMMIRSLADDTAGRAWLIVTAITKVERAAWIDALGPKASLVVIEATADQCLARIAADPARAEAIEGLSEAVRRWERTPPIQTPDRPPGGGGGKSRGILPGTGGTG
ncbi:HNH endonuclease [Pseudogemmobacter sonorensis]|uniref:HNH endonuclease n=1 Tax=Pseudogemmobacter sonorensis TaxID=2989681 RepID=UPI00368F99FD